MLDLLLSGGWFRLPLAEAVTAVMWIVAVLSVGTAAYSYVAQKKAAKKASQVTTQDRSKGALYQIRGGALPRRIIYGRHRVGGIEAYVTAHGPENEWLDYILIWADGPCEEVEKILFDGVEVELEPIDSANPHILVAKSSSPWAGCVRVESELGDSTNPPPHGVGIIPGWGDNNENNLLRGICYSWVELKYDADKFPNGVPNISAVIKGRKDIWDPRIDDYAYTDNVALIFNHYMTLDPRIGPGADYATEIGEEELIAAANICDELVDIPLEVDSSGATSSGMSSGELNPQEKRYTYNGIVGSERNPEEIIEEFRTAMAGASAYISGRFRMWAGAYQIPTFEIDQRIVLSVVKTKSRPGKRNRFNTMRGVYASDRTVWVPTDFPAVTEAAFVTEDGEIVDEDVDLLNSGSPYRAQRIASIFLRRNRFGREVQITCMVDAWRVQPGGTCLFHFPRLKFSHTPMDVLSMDFVLEKGDVQVNLHLRETDPSIYDEPDLDPLPRIPQLPQLPQPPKPPPKYEDLQPKLPIAVVVDTQEREGLLVLTGFSEFTSPATPPKKYLQRATSGEMETQRHQYTTTCSNPCPGSNRSDFQNVTDGFGNGSYSGYIAVQEISRTTTHVTFQISYSSGPWYGVVEAIGPVSNGGTFTKPMGTPFSAWLAWPVHPYNFAGVCVTPGELGPVIDTWAQNQTHDPDTATDGPLTGSVTYSDWLGNSGVYTSHPYQSAINAGRPDLFYIPLRNGFEQNLEKHYTDVVETPMQRTTTGKGCVPSQSEIWLLGGPMSTEANGQVFESLSNENTEEDAIGRFQAATPWGTLVEGCVGGILATCGHSAYQARTGFTFSYKESRVQARLANLDPTKSYTIRIMVDKVDMATGAVFTNAAVIVLPVIPSSINPDGSHLSLYADIPVQRGYEFHVAPPERRYVLGEISDAEELLDSGATEEEIRELQEELDAALEEAQERNRTRTAVVPLTGADYYRLLVQQMGFIRDGEIHTTSDHHRMFVEGYHVGPVFHGNVPDENTMIGLNDLSLNTVDAKNPTGRGCFSMDMCYRTDTSSVWLCAYNRGESLTDWIDLGGLSSEEVDDLIDGLHAGDELAEEVDGGDAGDEFTDEVDGNPEI